MGVSIVSPVVLITGASGLLGSRLAGHLYSRGYQLLLASRRKPDELRCSDSVEFVDLDWNDEIHLAEVCSKADFVVHCAGMNAADCSLDPAAALTVNGVYTAKLATAAHSSSVGRLIHFSTAHVYRSPLIGVMDETSELTNMHPYATSNHAGERALEYWRQSEPGLSWVVLRVSNAIGAPAWKGRIAGV